MDDTPDRRRDVSDFYGELRLDVDTLKAGHDSLARKVDNVEQSNEKAVELLAGQPEVDPFGRPTGRRVGGIVADLASVKRSVAKLEHDANGGRGITLRKRDRALIIAGIPLLVVALEIIREVAFG